MYQHVRSLEACHPPCSKKDKLPAIFRASLDIAVFIMFVRLSGWMDILIKATR